MKKRKENNKLGWSRLNRKAVNFLTRQLESENFKAKEGQSAGQIEVIRPGKKVLKVHLLERDSEWKAQFLAKQKIKYFYGDLSEKSLRYSIRAAHREKIQPLVYLEKRLDVLVYRLNMATSIDEAGSLIRQGFIWVNGRQVRQIGQIIQVGSHIENKQAKAWLNYYKSRVFDLQNAPSISKNWPSHLLSLSYNQGILLKNPSEREIYLPLDFNVHKFALYASRVL